MFGMCSIFLFVASILQRRLSAIGDRPSKYILAMFQLYISIIHEHFGVIVKEGHRPHTTMVSSIFQSCRKSVIWHWQERLLQFSEYFFLLYSLFSETAEWTMLKEKNSEGEAIDDTWSASFYNVYLLEVVPIFYHRPLSDTATCFEVEDTVNFILTITQSWESI